MRQFDWRRFSATTMRVCSCNIIRTEDIDRVARELLAADPFHVLTPGTVFRRLGLRPRCAGCFPLIVALLHEQCDKLRAAGAESPCAPADMAED